MITHLEYEYSVTSMVAANFCWNDSGSFLIIYYKIYCHVSTSFCGPSFHASYNRVEGIYIYDTVLIVHLGLSPYSRAENFLPIFAILKRCIRFLPMYVK